jgi:hypothetical protein
MLDKPNSPLRQSMIEDMMVRRFKEKVQKDYVRHIRNFAAFLGAFRSASQLEVGLRLRPYQMPANAIYITGYFLGGSICRSSRRLAIVDRCGCRSPTHLQR